VYSTGAPNSEEAPVVWSHGGFFYLFTNWNADKADYQVHVARSSVYVKFLIPLCSGVSCFISDGIQA
jgi:hypothetical protein